MAGREWTVEVRANNKKSRNDGVYFRVVLPGVKKGAPLRAKPNDVLVLSNRTDWDLAFESTDPPKDVSPLQVMLGVVWVLPDHLLIVG